MTEAVQRQTNRRYIYQYLYNNSQPATSEELAEALSLGLPAVERSLAGLLEEGMISTAEGGTYVIAPQGRVALGVFLRDDQAQLLAIDICAQELGFRELSIPFSHTPGYYQKILQCLEEFIDSCGLDRDRLLGIGIVIPAVIDQAAGRLVMSPTLDLWDIPLEEIYCHFSRYPVFIENSPNSSGYAACWANREKSSAIYLSLDRGVGGAILQGDQQYMGDHGRSGEFGHMRLVPNGRLCSCGRRGCVEAYCSTSRLSDDLGITLDEFFTRLQGGDGEAAAVWEEYRGHLTDTLANLRVCFDCDIVLGGELSPHLEGLLPELYWDLGEKTLFEGDGFFLQLDRFGSHSVCAGTALRFIEDFLQTY